MKSWLGLGSGRHGRTLLAMLFLVLPATAPLACAQAAGSAGSRPGASLEDYRKHLEALQAVVAACRKQRSRDACNPDQVGPDDQVQWNSGSAAAVRAIRYDWLREALNLAGKKEEPQKAAAVPVEGVATKPVSVDELLDQAQQRLEGDWKQAGGLTTGGSDRSDYAAERKRMAAILARREYQGVTESSAWEHFQEWLENLLARIFGHLIGFGARSPWIAFALRALLLGSLCVGLVWALVRLERRSRVRLVPEARPGANAPSAREWQLWFQDAQRMASQGLWREAIHFLYWASISRLESKRMWPADRARTPREYLRLFPAADPRRDNLTALTRSFERTWYGGRAAGSSEFDAALKMAAGLGVE
jgi:hypothetical protein